MVYLYNITTNRQKEVLDLKEKKVSVHWKIWKEERGAGYDVIIVEIMLRKLFLNRTCQ